MADIYNAADRAELDAHAIRYEVAEAAGLRPSGTGTGFTQSWPDVDGQVHHIPRTHKAVRVDGDKGVRWPKDRTPWLKLVRPGTGRTVAIVEGYLQPSSFASWAPAEITVYGMNGCRGINSERVDLSFVSGQDVLLCLDADRHSNPDVAEAAARAVERLHDAGAAAVRIVATPGDGNDGIDDVLARLKEPAQRQALLAALVTSAGTVTREGAAGARREAQLAKEIERQRLQREARRTLDAEERPSAALPEVLTLAERLACDPEPVVWRIEGWQPAEARVVLAAPMKAGKTTLVGNLVRTLVDGGLFLNRDRVEPVTGSVVVLDFEMSGRQLDGWLRDQKIVNTDRVVVVPLRGRAGAFDVLDPDGRARWADLLRGRDAAYVVLDCLRPVLDALGLDEHRDAGRFLVAFDALLSEAGAAEACVVHHMGHTGERSRGDSRIRDWPDAEWRIVKQDDNPTSPAFLAAFGRDVEQPEARLTFEPTTRHLSLVGGSRREAKTTADLDAVVTYLRSYPDPVDRTQRRIREAQPGGLSERRVRAALNYGVEAGSLMYQPGPGASHVYSLVEGTVGPVGSSGTTVGSETWSRVVAPPLGGPTPPRGGQPTPVSTRDGTDTRACQRCGRPGDFGLVGTCPECRGQTSSR